MATEYGFVYVLQNDAMNGVYKIGATRRSPTQRAEELASATGVPGSFKVVYFAEVENPFAAERQVHLALDEYRCEGKEFFRCRLLKVIEEIRETGMVQLDAESDYVFEVNHPGTICGPRNPLYFESSLYAPGEIIALAKRARAGGAA